jgi:hypothetical protein
MVLEVVTGKAPGRPRTSFPKEVKAILDLNQRSGRAEHESYDKRPYEEALVVVEVPAGKMGRVIGKKGEAIIALKKSVEADIFTGGLRGRQIF